MVFFTKSKSQENKKRVYPPCGKSYDALKNKTKNPYMEAEKPYTTNRTKNAASVLSDGSGKLG